MKEVYVLNYQVHFGSIKTVVPKGTVVSIDRDRKVVEFNGTEHDNVGEVDMMIRAGYIAPYEKGKSSGKKADKPKARKSRDFDVLQSDQDLVGEIDIKSTKTENRPAGKKKMQVIKEEKNEITSRGIPVVKGDQDGNGVKADTSDQILAVVNGDDGRTVRKIPKVETPAKKPFGLSTTSDSNEGLSEIVNGEAGKVVKTIGKSESTKAVSSGRKLTAKHASAASEEKAKAAAEARKAASEKRRSSAKAK